MDSRHNLHSLLNELSDLRCVCVCAQSCQIHSSCSTSIQFNSIHCITFRCHFVLFCCVKRAKAGAKRSDCNFYWKHPSVQPACIHSDIYSSLAMQICAMYDLQWRCSQSLHSFLSGDAAFQLQFGVSLSLKLCKHRAKEPRFFHREMGFSLLKSERDSVISFDIFI